MQFCIMHQTCLDHLFVCKAMADWYDGKWILMLKLMALVGLQLYFMMARQTDIMLLDWSEGGCCCEWWWWLIFTCLVSGLAYWLTNHLLYESNAFSSTLHHHRQHHYHQTSQVSNGLSQADQSHSSRLDCRKKKRKKSQVKWWKMHTYTFD